MDFPSVVNPPTGVSYAAPQVNFSSLGDLLDSFGQGAQIKNQVNQATAFKGGLPRKPDGTVDFNKMSESYLQNNNPTAGVALANVGITRQAQDQVPALLQSAFGGQQQSPAPTGADAYFGMLKSKEQGSSATSSASGPYGITDPTWQTIQQKHPELQLPDKASATDQQHLAAAKALTIDNAGALGQNATPQNLYLAHFLGDQGAVQFLGGMQSNPNQPAVALASPAAVKANASLFFGKDGQPVPAQQFYNNLTKDFAPQPQPQRMQGPLSGMDPQHMLHAAIVLASNPATKEAGVAMLQAAMEQLKENQPKWEVIGQPGYGQRVYGRVNAQTGQVIPYNLPQQQQGAGDAPIFQRRPGNRQSAAPASVSAAPTISTAAPANLASSAPAAQAPTSISNVSNVPVMSNSSALSSSPQITATNPTTGQRMILQDGQWTPIR